MGRDKGAATAHLRQLYLLFAIGKIKCDQTSLLAELAYIDKTISRNTLDRSVTPYCESRRCATKLEQCMSQREHGAWVLALGCNVYLCVVSGDRKPGFRCGWTETGMRAIVPLHR